jgi:hypothetical protein
MAKSFKINAEGDLNIPFQFVNDELELVQRIKIALLTYKGEFFANTELGVDYYNTIFLRVPNLASFKDSVIRVLSGFEEILKINNIEISKSLIDETPTNNRAELTAILVGINIVVSEKKEIKEIHIYTDSKYSLGSYQELNGSDKVDYQYAISSWVFIDAAPPNTSSSYSKFTSLLNFANKPNVLYNGTTNTLMITTDQKNLKEVTKNKLIDFDENGNRIIYKNSNFLLQKWNNIIINYNGGVLDIFLNGELVKSDIGVVPYMTYDNLTIGDDDGIKGGICNVNYFKQALNSSNIFYLYNMVKDRSPPVLNDSNTTITKQNLNTISSSTKTVI